jgi:putative transposase
VRDDALLADNRRNHAANSAVYGARKIWHELRREGKRAARCTVQRLMRQAGLTGAVRGKTVRTTVPDPGHERAGDRVNRDFSAERPHRTWCADFTYVAAWCGIVYVAFVVDVYSRAIVGWSASLSKRTPLVLGALDMALWRRDRAGQSVPSGPVHHSDAGSQYTSLRFTTHLVAAGIDASIGTVGDALDNALMKSTIGLYKTEPIKPRGPWRSLTDVELATAEWVDWYNANGCTRRSDTSHPTSTNRCTTLNSSPVRWLEPTTEVSTEPGAVQWRRRCLTPTRNHDSVGHIDDRRRVDQLLQQAEAGLATPVNGDGLAVEDDPVPREPFPEDAQFYWQRRIFQLPRMLRARAAGHAWIPRQRGHPYLPMSVHAGTVRRAVRMPVGSPTAPAGCRRARPPRPRSSHCSAA